MQHEITKSAPLLDARGNVAEPGWARSLQPVYRRADIRAGKTRVKEWDYYIVCDDSFGVAFTIADNSYMGLISASALDFGRPWERTATVMTAFPMGKFGLPETSVSGDTLYGDKRVQMAFRVKPGERLISCRFGDFLDGKPLECELALAQPETDSMVVATPFDKSGHFYYNQKINCMRAEGSFTLGDLSHAFRPETAFATLDWGRGVWTYDNTWYWGNGNGVVNGKLLGFNIGYGFGDTSAASENMLFYGGRGHKLSQVAFHIPEANYLKPWTFSSDDGRFEMDFIPILDRASRTNALVIESDQHQVFGCFTGRAVLDDGTALEIKDFLGFAEKVRNRF
ncbi:MAG: hypothetical protein BWY35_01222 [Firmicutes bacterium ADurb.Bin248]|nr:MAG: hypothetical protein BWY35_01222 [Firmicutes bacterium ADurb.Bin248]HOF99760.1 DUF2804 domain-containing protein [Clostridia bacterium]HPK14698.1 DUF2804 domain-containing protein [Clostridia bacterium]